MELNELVRILSSAIIHCSEWGEVSLHVDTAEEILSALKEKNDEPNNFLRKFSQEIEDTP